MTIVAAGLLIGLAAWLVVGRTVQAGPGSAGAGPRRRRGTTDIAAVAGDLAALLRAGAMPDRAWELATRDLPEDAASRTLREAAGAARSAQSPTVALTPADGTVRNPGIQALGAAWYVGERTGAPLAVVLEAVAAAVRDAEDAGRARSAAMAGPVTTARILAALPLLGLGIGQAIGARPVQTLLGTGQGRVCAVVGLACALLGWVWTSRLIAAARADS